MKAPFESVGPFGNEAPFFDLPLPWTPMALSLAKHLSMSEVRTQG